MITVKADMGGVPEALTDILGNQLPFATALALTRVAQAGQAAGQELVPRTMTQRNDWTRKGIRIKPATKRDLVAEVYTDTSNRKTGAPDYLLGQQDGAMLVPVGGRHHRAVPTRYLRKICPGIIPDALRPKALFPPGVQAHEGDYFQGNFRTNVQGRANRATSRATRKSLGSGDYIAFLQRSKGGTLCIFVRHGGIAHKGAQNDAEPWYTLIRSAKLKPRFPLQQKVQEVVDKQFPEIFKRTAAEVLTNNALGKGLQVRF